VRPYSQDLREKIVKAVESGQSSVRKTAQRFSVSPGVVQKLVSQKRTQGHLQPRKQGGSISPLQPYYQQLQQLVAQQPDATLAEYCELMGESTGVWLSQSAMCRTLQRLN
jgi:transposase